jgi:hypothetical protein
MKKLTALFALLIFSSAQLLAWGPKGHQIVGDIARNHLTDTARHDIQQLLGNDDLAAIANWADDVRKDRPESYGWHFVDIPKDALGFSEARDCYQPDEKRPTSKDDHHNCVVDRINMFKQVAADRSAAQQDRVEALKYLVHFVGDLHQPLHAIGEARGGNDIHVVEFGSPDCGARPCNFHYEWDSGLLEHAGRSEHDYVTYLEQQIAANHWQRLATGTTEDWANQSQSVARKVWLDNGGAVDEAYYKANIGTVDQQLALAGLRLAGILNSIFADKAGQKRDIKQKSL